MVATRRQVHIGPDEEVVLEQDPDQLLKKKAARKPAAKTATTTKTETKAKGSVRGKKAETEVVGEKPKPTTRAARTKKVAVEEDAVPMEEQKAASGRTSRAAKTGSVRGKKATGLSEVATAEDEVAETKPTRGTKSTSVRGRKAPSTVEDAAEQIAVQTKSATVGSIRGRKAASVAQTVELPAPKEPKTTRSTRGAAKTAPLSPKKITQVNKAPAKTAKEANAKPAAKTTRSKAQGNAKPIGKRRAVSDENADISDFEVDFAPVEDVVVLPSTPVSTAAPPKRGAKQAQPVVVAESEASMSSRPTTPSDSPVQNFDAIEKEEDTHEANRSASEEEQSDAELGEASEDELCGPKTPMRRSTPSALARYQSSVQCTIRKQEEDPRMETPAIRYAVLGTQRGTPQTQKPYCKPTAPASETRPMTVSRATGRAFVFKDLHDGVPSLPEPGHSFEEQDEPSFLVDEDIIPMDTAESELNDGDFSTQIHQVMEMDEAQLIASSLVEEDAEDYVVPANVQRYSDDPDDTVIIQDDAENMEAPSERPAQSFETEDTVVITRAKSPVQEEENPYNEEETDDDSVIIHSPQATAASTHRAVESITVNFDEYLRNVRPQPEDVAVQRDDEPVDASSTQDTQDVDQAGSTNIAHDVSVIQDPLRRQTFDLNQFVDIGALSEPTLHMDIDMDEVRTAEAAEALPRGPQPHSVESAMSDTPFKVIQQAASPALNMPEDVETSIVAVQHEARPLEEVKVDDEEMSESPEHPVHTHEAMGAVEQSQMPHYALPTIAFDARRKSLPVLSLRTPIRTGTRPHTSDGASMPRIPNPFANARWARQGVKSMTSTPVKPRPSTAHATPNVSSFNTPARSRQFVDAESAVKTPKEKHPFFPSNGTYSGHRNTVAAPVRFATPNKNSPKRRETFHRAVGGKTVTQVSGPGPSTPAASTVTTPKERYPALKPRENYEEHAKTVAASVRFHDPTAKSANRRQTFHKVLPGQNIDSTATLEPVVATPNPKTPVPEPKNAAHNPETPGTEKEPATQERYPRLRPRVDYEEHAKTVAGPRRFQTPVKRSLKRPATVGKAASLRVAALTANTPPPSYTPIKTPLKAPAMTPNQVPMTPHPAAPLNGVVALVEVYTLEGASASAPFISLLHRLGAKTTRAWNDRITHVVFKDGSPTTLQRVRLANKDFEETGKGTYIHCVNSRWVTDCDTEGVREDESGDAYVVDVAEVPRGGKRRRKSMEPSALLNLGGNIVRDRKSSGGRVSSFGRSPLKFSESPAKIVEVAEVSTPIADSVGKENSGDEHSSPVTPAWIAAPNQLVQQTAPMRRVRKLELPGKGEAKGRRLTFWNGAA